jgi:hypothetical protein
MSVSEVGSGVGATAVMPFKDVMFPQNDPRAPSSGAPLKLSPKNKQPEVGRPLEPPSQRNVLCCQQHVQIDGERSG